MYATLWMQLNNWSSVWALATIPLKSLTFRGTRIITMKSTVDLRLKERSVANEVVFCRILAATVEMNFSRQFIIFNLKVLVVLGIDWYICSNV